MDSAIFVQLIISGLLIGFVFSLIAVGLTLIWGVMDILNFAHGDFLMIAMFTSFLMFAKIGLDPLLSLPIVTALLFLVGLLTFRLVIRPVLGYPGLIALLATFGLSIFIRNVVLLALGPNYRVINQSILAGKNISFLGVHFSVPQVASAIGCGWWWPRSTSIVASLAARRAASAKKGLLRGIGFQSNESQDSFRVDRRIIG